MYILIVLFTILLVIDCLFLGLLILVQLPKKEAGIGMAFGSGATDALFGAGSGTALSTMTKYTAGIFFILVFSLSILNNHATHPQGSDLKRELQKMSSTPTAPATAPATTTTTATTPAATNATPFALTVGTNTTAPATPPPSNAPATPAK